MKQLILSLVLVVVSYSAISQANRLPDPVFYFAAIIVSDIDTTIAWYSEKLGFELENRFASEERGFKQANLKRGNMLIELIETNTTLYQKDILADKAGKPKIEGYFKIGLALTDFDNWITHLTTTGVEFHGNIVTGQSSGKKMVIIKDPDGNRVQLFEQ